MKKQILFNSIKYLNKRDLKIEKPPKMGALREKLRENSYF